MLEVRLFGERGGVLFAPLKATYHATPLGGFGPSHLRAQRHPTRSGLLDNVRRCHPVDDRYDLVGVAPGTPWGTLHAYLLMLKSRGSYSSKDTPAPAPRVCFLFGEGGKLDAVGEYRPSAGALSLVVWHALRC